MIRTVAILLLMLTLVSMIVTFGMLPETVATQTMITSYLSEESALYWNKKDFSLTYLGVIVITNIVIYLLLPIISHKYPKLLLWRNRNFWFQNEEYRAKLTVMLRDLLSHSGLYVNMIFLLTYIAVFSTNLNIADVFQVLFLIGIFTITALYLRKVYRLVNPQFSS